MIAINGEKIEPTCFTDGTLDIKYEPNFRDIAIDWAFDSNDEMILLYMLVKHIRANFHVTNLTLNLPYIPNARRDRVKNINEIFTLKYFCDFINNLNFDAVIVCHPHSAVAPALLNNVIVNTSFLNYISNILKEEKIDIICFPDEGAKRNFPEEFQLPVVYGSKIRDWETKEIKKVFLNASEDVSLRDKNILIVDDICGTGKTFDNIVKVLKEYKPKKITCYATHCENTLFENKFFNNKCFLDDELINKLYTTDSIFTNKMDKVFVYKCFRTEE